MKLEMIQVDLPMPEACQDCPLNYDFCWCNGMDYETWEVYSDDWNRQVCEGTPRPEYCPLKESEVICCKDCQFYYEGANEVDSWMRCRLHSINAGPDEFCSWAVAKRSKA